MEVYGKGTLAEFLEDRVIYRNLIPMDKRLPTLGQLRTVVGLPEAVTPRKSEPAYGQVVAQLLHAARALDAPATDIQRILYIGDTRLNDGTAFANICRAGGWPGLAFIGAEQPAEGAKTSVVSCEGLRLYLANRWALLAEFEHYCQDQSFPVDTSTAVIVDLDKTALGARGRNDQVINHARVAAVRRTVGDLLGDAFDTARFQTAYDTLNQTEFHPFTTDNQDYLAYMCLIIGSGLYRLTSLVDEIHQGKLESFAHFVANVDARAEDLPANLRAIHSDIYTYVRQGDPTPFKAFRRNEYHTTIEAMGWATDTAPISDLLAREIVITQEVREMSLKWKAQGALLFGLSDKPDEASIPTAASAAEGYRPIHQTETHILGS